MPSSPSTEPTGHSVQPVEAFADVLRQVMKAVSQGKVVKEGAGLPESKQDHCFQFVFFLAHTLK